MLIDVFFLKKKKRKGENSYKDGGPSLSIQF